MLPRFLAPDLATRGVFTLPPGEASHAIRVLRLGRGAEVLVFDGRGRQVRGLVEEAGRSGVTIRAIAPAAAAPEPSVRLTLVQAVIRADAMDRVVRDATMMGVAAIQPIVADRTNVSVETLLRRRSVDRWRRVAVASAKQCGRAVVPVIDPPSDVAGWLETEMSREEPERARVMFVEPAVAGRQAIAPSTLAETPRPRSAVLAIGPEGGWSTEELEGCRRGRFVALTLGPRTFRAEAMALAGLAIVQFVWGDLGAVSDERGG